MELTKFCDPEICDACNNYIQQLRQSHASHFYHLIFGHFSVDCRPWVAGKIDLFLIVVYSILFYLGFYAQDVFYNESLDYLFNKDSFLCC